MIDHLTVSVKSFAKSRAFYLKVLKPGVRKEYHPNYYGAFVIDPDGHPIEAVCHSPIGKKP